MKTRATFYMFRFRSKSSGIEIDPNLEGFEKGFGFDVRTRVDLCKEEFKKATGMEFPSGKLFKATLILKQIGQRGLRK